MKECKGVYSEILRKECEREIKKLHYILKKLNEMFLKEVFIYVAIKIEGNILILNEGVQKEGTSVLIIVSETHYKVNEKPHT